MLYVRCLCVLNSGIWCQMIGQHGRVSRRRGGHMAAEYARGHREAGSGLGRDAEGKWAGWLHSPQTQLPERSFCHFTPSPLGMHADGVGFAQTHTLISQAPSNVLLGGVQIHTRRAGQIEVLTGPCTRLQEALRQFSALTKLRVPDCGGVHPGESNEPMIVRSPMVPLTPPAHSGLEVGVIVPEK
jgi:hypothetical protein